MLAANEGQINAIKLLIKKGANVNMKDTRGWTALRKAVGNGHLEAATVLKSYGAR